MRTVAKVYGNARDVIGRAPSPLSRPLSRPLSSPHSRETGEDARAGAAWRDRGRAPWADSAAPRPPTSDSAAARPRPHSAAARPPTSSPSHVLVREGHGERGERGGLASGREGGRRGGRGGRLRRRGVTGAAPAPACCARPPNRSTAGASPRAVAVLQCTSVWDLCAAAHSSDEECHGRIAKGGFV